MFGGSRSKSRLKRSLCDIGHRGGATVGGESDNHRSKTAFRNEMDIEDGLSICIDAGPCYQIAAVVDGLSCGLVGKIVAWLDGALQAALGRCVRPGGRWLWLGVI